MNLVARADYAYVGKQFARNFNTAADRIPAYDVVNAQLTLNGPEDQWFLRAFVQNVENDDLITFLHVTDQTSALFTNVFKLEPRRYGIGGGFRF